MKKLLYLSHELRTPIGIVKGCLELVEAGDLPTQAFRRVLQEQLVRLEETIEALLEHESQMLASERVVPSDLRPEVSGMKDDPGRVLENP